MDERDENLYIIILGSKNTFQVVYGKLSDTHMKSDRIMIQSSWDVSDSPEVLRRSTKERIDAKNFVTCFGTPIKDSNPLATWNKFLASHPYAAGLYYTDIEPISFSIPNVHDLHKMYHQYMAPDFIPTCSIEKQYQFIFKQFKEDETEEIYIERALVSHIFEIYDALCDISKRLAVKHNDMCIDYSEDAMISQLIQERTTIMANPEVENNSDNVKKNLKTISQLKKELYITSTSTSYEQEKWIKLQPHTELELIRGLRNGESVFALSVRFGIPKHKINYLKEKLKATPKVRPKNATKIKEALDRAILLWVHKKLRNNIALSDSMIRLQALKLNIKLGGRHYFQASRTWLQKFKLRYNLNFNNIEELLTALDLYSLTVTNDSSSDDQLMADDTIPITYVKEEIDISDLECDNVDETTDVNASIQEAKQAASSIQKFMNWYQKQTNAIDTDILVLGRLFDFANQQSQDPMIH